MKNTYSLKLIFLIIILSFKIPTIGQNGFNKYLNSEQIQLEAQKIARSNSNACKLHELTKSPGGLPISVLEIGYTEKKPAVFVAANMDGNNPISTLAALHLCKEILKKKTDHKWFILFNGNPDALDNFFKPVQYESCLNQLEVNQDMDESIDEDSPEDLNKDGFITWMKIPDPTGLYIEDKTIDGLIKKADPLQNESGRFRIEIEGIDNDGDGLFNEDPKGGVNINKNFPHLFKHFTPEYGQWPGSAQETYAIMEFIFKHPEIIITISLGNNDFFENLPKKSKTSIDTDNIKVSKRTASRLGIDPKNKYSISELKKIASEVYPQRNFTTAYIASMAGLGEVQEVFPQDLKYFQKISKESRKLIEKDLKRIKPESIENGSFEKWAYYHLGIPSFAISMWSVPLIKDTTIHKKHLNYASVIKSETPLLNNGFIAWESFNHPQLGNIEIGGIAPYTLNNPPVDKINEVVTRKTPMILNISSYLPEIVISETKHVKKGNDLYEIEATIQNKGFLPWPLMMGQWNGQVSPIVLELKSDELEVLNGKMRTPIASIDGLQTIRIKWLVKTKNIESLSIELQSEQGWNELKNFKN